MLRRTWHLARARLAMVRRTGWPIPAFVFLAALAAGLALLVRDVLPPFPYAFVALSVGGLLLTFPLLSDLGGLLRHDEGGEWVGALPALAAERALARTLHVLVLLGGLVVSWFVPWAILAPAALGAVERAALPGLGFVLALLLATLLVWTQQLLLARFATAFVLFESALVLVVVVALVELLGHLPELAALAPNRAGTRWLPPAWLARPLVEGGWRWGVPLCAALASLATLLVVPVREAEPVRRRGWIERCLEPLRRIALRSWVRPRERGAFDLVYLALPREREVALRTYPLLGIPLAFLWVGASGPPGEHASWRADLLALLLFTAGVYLPLLLTHVPLTESPEAAWILRMAPSPPAAVAGGAIKALFVRYLLPLYCGLLGLGLLLAEARMLARLWLPAALLGLVLLRVLYPRCVRDLPLSIGPDELRAEVDWAGLVATLAVGSTLGAVVANRLLDWTGTLLLTLLLCFCEVALERRLGRGEVSAGG